MKGPHYGKGAAPGAGGAGLRYPPGALGRPQGMSPRGNALDRGCLSGRGGVMLPHTERGHYGAGTANGKGGGGETQRG